MRSILRRPFMISWWLLICSNLLSLHALTKHAARSCKTSIICLNEKKIAQKIGEWTKKCVNDMTILTTPKRARTHTHTHFCHSSTAISVNFSGRFVARDRVGEAVCIRLLAAFCACQPVFIFFHRLLVDGLRAICEQNRRQAIACAGRESISPILQSCTSCNNFLCCYLPSVRCTDRPAY